MLKRFLFALIAATLALVPVANAQDSLGQFGPTTSTELRNVLTDETGTGVAVFGTSPTITTPTLSGTTTISSTGSIFWSGRAGISSPSDGALVLSNNALTTQIALVVEAQHILAQRNGTNSQSFRVYNTFTDASNYERVHLTFATNIPRLEAFAAGTGTFRALQIVASGSTILGIEDNYLSAQSAVAVRRDGTSGPTQFLIGGTGLTSTALNVFRLTPSINQASGAYTIIDINPTETAIGAGIHYFIKAHIAAGGVLFGVRNSGQVDAVGVVSSSFLQAGTGSGIYFGSNGSWSAPNDGVFLARDNAIASFDRIQFGGTSASFPALKRNTTSLEAKLANDSAFTKFKAASFELDGSVGSNFTGDASGVVGLRNGVNPQSLAVYGTYTDASNYERAQILATSGVWQFTGSIAGTGVARTLRFGGSTIMDIDPSSGIISMNRSGSSASTILQLNSSGVTSTAVLYFRLTPSINQASGTYTMLDINPTETLVGAGPHYFIRGRIAAGGDLFAVRSDGFVSSANAIQAARHIRTAAQVFAGIGTPGGTGSGSIAYITDCNTAVLGATAAGGGANLVLVISNGTNWKVAAVLN